MLIITPQIRIPRFELQFSFARSSGPGGQNVNKVNSKAILHWNVMHNKTIPELVRIRFCERYQNKMNADGFLVLSSDRFRDQAQNMEDCLEKLSGLLKEVAFPPKIRRATKPKFSAKKKRLESKTKRGEIKKGRGRVDY